MYKFLLSFIFCLISSIRTYAQEIPAWDINNVDVAVLIPNWNKDSVDNEVFADTNNSNNNQNTQNNTSDDIVENTVNDTNITNNSEECECNEDTKKWKCLFYNIIIDENKTFSSIKSKLKIDDYKIRFYKKKKNGICVVYRKIFNESLLAETYPNYENEIPKAKQTCLNKKEQFSKSMTYDYFDSFSGTLKQRTYYDGFNRSYALHYYSPKEYEDLQKSDYILENFQNNLAGIYYDKDNKINPELCREGKCYYAFYKYDRNEYKPSSNGHTCLLICQSTPHKNLPTNFNDPSLCLHKRK